MPVTQNLIDILKSFEWDAIITKCNKLEDLNDRQWRFVKGLIIELIVEKHSLGQLEYVGEDHKDYNWPSQNKTVELKSNVSSSMYGKKGELCKNFTIKFTNSLGTNNKDTLDPADVCDMVLVVKNDGAFILDKETVIKRSIKDGDGFTIKVGRDEIIEITGKKIVSNVDSLNLKENITNAIRAVI